MEKEIWRFIDSGYRSPSFNMALDEALLDWNSKGEIPPVIRFYGWNPATLSVGYFQKVEKEINLEAVKNQGWALFDDLRAGEASSMSTNLHIV